jgi:hypothetical protein
MQTMLPLFLSIYSLTALIIILNNIPLGQSPDSDPKFYLWYSPSMINSDSQRNPEDLPINTPRFHNQPFTMLINSYFQLPPFSSSAISLSTWGNPPKIPFNILCPSAPDGFFDKRTFGKTRHSAGKISRISEHDLRLDIGWEGCLKEDDAREGLGERCVYTLEGWGQRIKQDVSRVGSLFSLIHTYIQLTL